MIARNSCFQFRGDVDVAVVRSALGVRYVVEGSVRKAGDRIRVTAQLIDALDRPVWAERYDREGAGISSPFRTRSPAASSRPWRVASRRRAPSTPAGTHRRLGRLRLLPAGPRAQLRLPADGGRAALRPRRGARSGYAHAHAWRAIALGVIYLHDGRQDTLDAALASARTALALDDNDARCHYAMAYVALRRGEYDLAGHHHDRAHSLNPNDPDIAAGRANWLMHVGRLDEALATLDAAIERDPFPPTWHWDVRGYVLYHLGRYAEAINAFRSVRAEPFWIVGMLAAAYAQAGQPDQASRSSRVSCGTRPGSPWRSVGRQDHLCRPACTTIGSRDCARPACRNSSA